jgi:hypothetical protein
MLTPTAAHPAAAPADNTPAPAAPPPAVPATRAASAAVEPLPGGLDAVEVLNSNHPGSCTARHRGLDVASPGAAHLITLSSGAFEVFTTTRTARGPLYQGWCCNPSTRPVTVTVGPSARRRRATRPTAIMAAPVPAQGQAARAGRVMVAGRFAGRSPGRPAGRADHDGRGDVAVARAIVDATHRTLQVMARTGVTSL